MISKQQMEQNKITFSEFNIGDKVTITHLSQEPRKDDVVELGVVKKFGYNCTDELIIGVEIIKKYDIISIGENLQWLHPRNKISSIEKL